MSKVVEKVVDKKVTNAQVKVLTDTFTESQNEKMKTALIVKAVKRTVTDPEVDLITDMLSEVDGFNGLVVAHALNTEDFFSSTIKSNDITESNEE